MLHYNLKIYNEDGTLIMNRDSASLTMQASSLIFYNIQQIYFDGTNTKMMLPIGVGGTFYYYEIYSLPGSIPCSDCSQGITTGMVEGSGSDKSSMPYFYPNPASQFLKLKYVLPEGVKKAFIKVYDTTGKLVQDLEITNAFDSILLPANYSNGLYKFTTKSGMSTSMYLYPLRCNLSMNRGLTCVFSNAICAIPIFTKKLKSNTTIIL